MVQNINKIMEHGKRAMYNNVQDIMPPIVGTLPALGRYVLLGQKYSVRNFYVKTLRCTVKYRKLANKLYNMDLTISKKGEKRVEFRVSNEDKELFEYARELKGFKTFSEFARYIITREAKAIVKEENKILASKRDKELFFNALMGEEHQPNESLLAAIKYHDELITA